MAGVVDLTGMDWEEEFRAEGWKWEEYRRGRFFAGTQDQYEANRQFWEHRNLPKGGRYPRAPKQRRHPNPLPFTENPVIRTLANPSLLGLTPQGNPVKFRRARYRYHEVQNFFAQESDRLKVEAPLQYGGNGLAVKCSFQEDNAPNKTLFVVKVGLTGWENFNLRMEEKETRRFRRSAHMVQMLDREAIDLPRFRRFKYDEPPEDDSSSEEEPSDDESVADIAPNVPTRRQIMNQDPQRLVEKKFRWRERRRATLARIYNRARQKSNPNRDPMWDYDRKDLLVLEYCENGDLQNLIYRLNEDNRDVPNRVLCSFWLCLVRACIGMQYPVHKFHPGRKSRIPAKENHPPPNPNLLPGFDYGDTGKRLGTDLFEGDVGIRRRWAARRIVHFDIDPKNILITGFDPHTKDTEHELIPRLKLGDFGLTGEVKLNKRNEYYAERRRYGKYGYMAPEQWGVEWDYIRRRDGHPLDKDGAEIGEQLIAGNYGSWTNVWQIAMVMWQLVTKFRAPMPPQIQNNTPFAQRQLPVHCCPLLLDDQRYEWVDYELRETIARCLAYEPLSRPRPRSLLQGALRGIRKSFDGETDNRITTWVNNMIVQPTMPNANANANAANNANIHANPFAQFNQLAPAYAGPHGNTTGAVGLTNNMPNQANLNNTN
ncbi:kinase-like domain-containing protein [Xylariaceae sp. FL1019]|nr:kinase-like domain-containing protein [Xylariaceae sp. FL1019]